MIHKPQKFTERKVTVVMYWNLYTKNTKQQAFRCILQIWFIFIRLQKAYISKVYMPNDQYFYMLQYDFLQL